MAKHHIHITGASGAGVTTMGRALAEALGCSHHDTDDYYWLPSDPPYRETRSVEQRLALMQQDFLGLSDWVLSGSLDEWSETLVPLFDLVVFVDTPTMVRLKRLWEREAQDFGKDAVAPGGWRHEETTEFVEWASHYDDGTREGRNRPRHEAWLKTLPCPLVRVDGARPIADSVTEVLSALKP